MLDCSQPTFTGAQMLEGVPAFTFTIDVQEFDARVNVKDGSDYVWTPPPEAAEPAEGSEEE